MPQAEGRLRGSAGPGQGKVSHWTWVKGVEMGPGKIGPWWSYESTLGVCGKGALRLVSVVLGCQCR